MPALSHTYVTAHGEWTTANWLGEKAQIGFRLPTIEDSAAPAKGTVFTPVANGDVAQDSGTQAGTNGTLSRTWTARLGPIASIDNMDAANQCDLADDVWTFLNATKSLVAQQFRWTHVKIAPILADGTYGAPSAIYQFTSAMVGTNAAFSTLPPELALAVSLRAPIIGRRGRGRIYFPGLCSGSLNSTDGTVATATQTTLRDAMSTLVGNLGDNPGAEVYGTLLAVMSAGSATAVRPSQVRVGNHFDVQRRRQHQVPESYSSVNL